MDKKDGEKYPFLTRNMLAFEYATAIGLSIRLKGPLGATVAIRGLTKEGPFNLKVPIVATGVSQTNLFEIPDIPILISVVDNIGNLSQGDLFADLNLTINNTNSYSLCSGWVYKNKSISWPITSNTDIMPGRGNFCTIAPALDPAAGAQFSYTFPAGYTYRIIAIRATLATAVAVANRRASFGVTFDGNDHYITYSLIDQAASLTRYYRMSLQPSLTTVQVSDIQIQIPQEMWVHGGDVFFSSTVNMQAADTWYGLELLVESFIIS